MHKLQLYFTKTPQQRLFKSLGVMCFFRSISPSLPLLKLLSHSLDLPHVLSSLHLYLQVHSYLDWPHIEFLSRHTHKLPATLGLNSKEMSIKSQANGWSRAQQQWRQEWPLDRLTSPRVIACHVPYCFTFHIKVVSVIHLKLSRGGQGRHTCPVKRGIIEHHTFSPDCHGMEWQQSQEWVEVKKIGIWIWMRLVRCVGGVWVFT